MTAKWFPAILGRIASDDAPAKQGIASFGTPPGALYDLEKRGNIAETAMLRDISKPLTPGSKQAIEKALRHLLANLPEGETFSTNQVAKMIADEPSEAMVAYHVFNLGKRFRLAERGEPRPANGNRLPEGTMVRPLVWRRLVTTMPYAPRTDASQASPIRDPINDLSTRLDDLTRRVAELEALNAALEEVRL